VFELGQTIVSGLHMKPICPSRSRVIQTLIRAGGHHIDPLIIVYPNCEQLY
jgi:hypothetical protein